MNDLRTLDQYIVDEIAVMHELDETMHLILLDKCETLLSLLIYRKRFREAADFRQQWIDLGWM